MIHSCTSFGKLKEVVVGKELSLDRRIMDITFKQFYKESLGQDVYESRFDGYSINIESVIKRNQDLDGLANVLEKRGIVVHRPDTLNKVVHFQTPTFKSEMTSANNVRDITLVYNDKLIETPTYIRNRYFENMSLYKVFNKAFDNGKGGQWIKAPNTRLTEATVDLDDWREQRDFDNIDSRYEMAIDGAQFLRIGKDVIVNVTTYNHYLGFQWVKSFFPESTFHMVSIADNHIDGAIISLKPGVFLLDPKYKKIIDQLPQKFKTWKYLIPNEDDLTKNIDVRGMTDIDIRLASSRGMDINILSIDENTCVVYDRAVCVKQILEENGFEVITVPFDNGEIFAGGIHCSTLDLVREDEYVYY